MVRLWDNGVNLVVNRDCRYWQSVAIVAYKQLNGLSGSWLVILFHDKDSAHFYGETPGPELQAWVRHHLAGQLRKLDCSWIQRPSTR